MKVKAKVKATGKVVEATLDKCSVPVAGYGARSVYECSDGKKYFDTELDFINVYPDWQQVRIQAAISAMNGLLTGTSAERYTLRIKPEQIAKDANEYADALIKELQKEMEVNNE